MSYAVKLIAYVLITLFLGVILRELGFKGSRLVLLLGMISVIGASVTYVSKMIELYGMLGMGSDEYAVAMIKIVGTGYVFGICADICSELGEGGLANAVCLFGRIEAVTLSAPFVKMIVEKGIELI